MPGALEFENLAKEYRSFASRRRLRALDDFTLQVETGEIFGFLGPNGAGKSTAIHLAMGFMRPTSGSGRMLGQPFGYAPARRRVGFLAENVALYHRRAESLVRFYGALNGMRGSYLAKRAREALAAVGLQDQAGRNVGKFSRGMLQRVGLAQALVNDPDLLILDEPTSALDPLARVAVRELLLKDFDDGLELGRSFRLDRFRLQNVVADCEQWPLLARGRGEDRRIHTPAARVPMGPLDKLMASWHAESLRALLRALWLRMAWCDSLSSRANSAPL